MRSVALALLLVSATALATPMLEMPLSVSVQLTNNPGATGCPAGSMAASAVSQTTGDELPFGPICWEREHPYGQIRLYFPATGKMADVPFGAMQSSGEPTGFQVVEDPKGSELFEIYRTDWAKRQEALMPPAVRKLTTAEESANDACRGGSGKSSATDAACKKRDSLIAAIKYNGWCWGHANQYGAARDWVRCLPGD